MNNIVSLNNDTIHHWLLHLENALTSLKIPLTMHTSGKFMVCKENNEIFNIQESLHHILDIQGEFLIQISANNKEQSLGSVKGDFTVYTNEDFIFFVRYPSMTNREIEFDTEVVNYNR